MFKLFIFTNSVFLGILLFLRPSKVKNANIFLSLFLFSLSFELLPDFFEEDVFLPETSFLTVPLLFLYVRRLIYSKIKPVTYILLLPFVLSNVLVEFIPISEEPDILRELLTQFPFYAFNLYLLFFMYSSISRHQSGLEEQFANLDRRTLKWVKGLVWIFLTFHLVWVLEDFLRLSGLDSPIPAFISEVLTLLSVFWVGYYGLSQLEANIEVPVLVKPSGTLNKLREVDRAAFLEVRRKVEQNKLYLNQELTLRLLSQQVGVNEKKLSAWINEFTESNFYQMINSYRIAEFKAQLSDPANKNFSLLGIAQNSGFRNKSTFYKVFKEFEGITPSEYKKSSFE